MPSATTGKRCADTRWLWRIGRLLAVALSLVGTASANDDRAVRPPIETLEDLPQLDPSAQRNTHKVVLITADSLNPAKVELAQGQLIAWISYSPSESTVVFERSVAKSMICHSRVNFFFDEGELRSVPIRTGEFASFCQLKPGNYRYKVLRSNTSDTDRADASETLEGEIIIGEE